MVSLSVGKKAPVLMADNAPAITLPFFRKVEENAVPRRPVVWRIFSLRKGQKGFGNARSTNQMFFTLPGKLEMVAICQTYV